MSRPVPKHAVDPDTGEIDFDAMAVWEASLSVNRLFQGAVDAVGALDAFAKLVRSGDLNLDHLNLDTADPLVADVEAFVHSYRKLYGDPVR
jgi:hypothetical protein